MWQVCEKPNLFAVEMGKAEIVMIKLINLTSNMTPKQHFHL